MTERLQKILSQAGIASRRKSEELILNGRVSVNGTIITKLGTKVSVNDQIEVDKKKIIRKKELIYFLLNKPSGYISTTAKFQNQKSITDLIQTDERIYPIGRLDKDTTGAILLTNDGDLTLKLTHPSFRVEKVYVARVKGNIREEELKKMDKPMEIQGIKYLSVKYEMLQPNLIKMHLTEGKNHEVKNILNFIGHPVIDLKRTKFANLKISDLKIGEYRELTLNEIEKLKSL
jgi:23S rRNA pseudouridine2605 synthase